jgi:hypothetical protein
MLAVTTHVPRERQRIVAQQIAARGTHGVYVFEAVQ